MVIVVGLFRGMLSKPMDRDLRLSMCGSKLLRWLFADDWPCLVKVLPSIFGKYREISGLIAGTEVAI